MKDALYRQRYLNDSVLDVIEPAADKRNLSLPEIAFRRLVYHSQVRHGGGNGILLSVSSFTQLQGNLDMDQAGQLPGDVVVALNQAWMGVKGISANDWYSDLEYTYDTMGSLIERDRR